MRLALLCVLALLALAVLWWRGDRPAVPPAASSGARTVEAQERALHEAGAANEGALALAPRAVVAAELHGEEPAVCKATLHGRLLDPSGQGVAGVVRVRDQPLAGGGWEELTKIATAEDGVFTIELRAGSRYELRGTAEAFGASDNQVLDVIDGRPLSAAMLWLKPYDGIRGVVVDELGAPRSGIVVLTAVRPTDAYYPYRLESNSDSKSLWRKQCGDDGSFAFKDLRTDRTFRLTYLPRPNEAVFVEWEGLRAGDRGLRLVASSEDLRVGSVAGVVRKADGDPCARYQIQVDGRTWKNVRNAEGRFQVRAQWGCEAPILVRASERASAHCFGTCRVDRDEQQLVLQLPLAGSLVVRARDLSGACVPGASVAAELDVWATRGATKWRPPLSIFAGFPQTDAAGEVHLDGLGVGPYRLTVWTLAAGAQAGATVRGGEIQTIDVVLAPR